MSEIVSTVSNDENESIDIRSSSKQVDWIVQGLFIINNKEKSIFSDTNVAKYFYKKHSLSRAKRQEGRSTSCTTTCIKDVCTRTCTNTVTGAVTSTSVSGELATVPIDINPSAACQSGLDCLGTIYNQQAFKEHYQIYRVSHMYLDDFMMLF